MVNNCRLCGNTRPLTGECPHCGSHVLPEDYEPCGDCGFDHQYELVSAREWHTDDLARALAKRVRCVNASGCLAKSHLVEGQIYTVKSEDEGDSLHPPCYYLVELGEWGWYKSRFQEVKPEEVVPSTPMEAPAPTEEPFDFDAYNGIRR